ncbi:hypothetical protein MmTuc01_3045 [Methanosarcina mazei Tuc01]|uniref:Uncharacterized protein n=1 Tax=Methanosarcina mazei Tuc01 TaxID=1236903 RepID=M1QMQ5_METMZ|nr:hypothetical protein MmTuc01_3045 [Methanosarcina mazei Tuc01]
MHYECPGRVAGGNAILFRALKNYSQKTILFSGFICSFRLLIRIYSAFSELFEINACSFF